MGEPGDGQGELELGARLERPDVREKLFKHGRSSFGNQPDEARPREKRPLASGLEGI